MQERRWVVYYDMYDTRGKLLKRDSDNDIFASSAIVASNIVRKHFHESSAWPHVRVRITGAKLYGNQSKSIAGMKDFVVIVSYDIGKGDMKHQSTNLMAKNKKEAETRVRQFLKAKYPKAKVLSIKANEVDVV